MFPSLNNQHLDVGVYLWLCDLTISFHFVPDNERTKDIRMFADAVLTPLTPELGMGQYLGSGAVLTGKYLGTSFMYVYLNIT